MLLIAGGVLLSAIVMVVVNNNLNLASGPVTSSDYSTRIQNYLSSGAGAENDGDWIIVGNNQYSGVPGNVGIGTTDPQAKLEVNGKILMDSATDASDSANVVATKGYVDGLQSIPITASDVNASQIQLRVTGNCSVGSYITAIALDGHVTCGAVPVQNATWNTSGVNQYSAVSGNVGIGMISPAQKLSVAGTVQSTSGGFMFPDGTVQATRAGVFSASGCTQVSNASYCAGGTHCPVSVTCPASTYVVGGGCYGNPAHANNCYMDASVPLSVITPGAQGWHCNEYIGPELTWGTWPDIVYAICCP